MVMHFAACEITPSCDLHEFVVITWRDITVVAVEEIIAKSRGPRWPWRGDAGRTVGGTHNSGRGQRRCAQSARSTAHPRGARVRASATEHGTRYSRARTSVPSAKHGHLLALAAEATGSAHGQHITRERRMWAWELEQIDDDRGRASHLEHRSDHRARLHAAPAGRCERGARAAQRAHALAATRTGLRMPRSGVRPAPAFFSDRVATAHPPWRRAGADGWTENGVQRSAGADSERVGSLVPETTRH